MEDYKEVLKVSAKPEKKIFAYLLGCVLFGLVLMLYCAYIEFIAITFIVPFLYISWHAFRQYYFLDKPSSVLAINFDENDQITVQLNNAEEKGVRIVDILQVKEVLILYFLETPSTAQSLTREDVKLLTYKARDTVFFQELLLFVGLRRLLFIVSEASLGKEQFRHLLRRVYAVEE